MYNLYTIDIACGKLVKGYDIFGVMILDFKQTVDRFFLNNPVIWDSVACEAYTFQK